jgi:hypothetical protein
MGFLAQGIKYYEGVAALKQILWRAQTNPSVRTSPQGP